MTSFRNSRNLMGRFTTTYEVESIGSGITADLQNPVGQSVLWWVFNPDETQVDPTYDVGNYWNRGRVWFTPFEIPVVLATIEQGPGGHNERGLYTVDMLRLVINTPEITPYLPNIVWEPDAHLLDRIEYRGGLFQPTSVYPKGHVQHSMTIIQVEAEQVKDEEVVNDVQFNGQRPYPAAFSDEFYAKDYDTEVNPPLAEFSDEFDPETVDAVRRRVEQVEHLERWGAHAIHDSDDLYGTRD